MKAVNLMIISGGQSGVDRAALDFALANDFKCGGYCPAGRMAEDGQIPMKYPLTELSNPTPAVRTQWNIMHSDATMVIYNMSYDFGTGLSIRTCNILKKPLLQVDLSKEISQEEFMEWLSDHKVYRLNIAGPRESSNRGIGMLTRNFLARILLKKVI